MAEEEFNVNDSLESVGRFGKWRCLELGLIHLISYVATCVVCPSLVIVFIGTFTFFVFISVPVMCSFHCEFSDKSFCNNPPTCMQYFLAIIKT